MTLVTITGDTIRDGSGRKDNRPWHFTPEGYQNGNPGVVTPRRSKPLIPSNGVLTAELEGGISGYIENPDGQRWLVTIPLVDSPLWEVIEAGVAFPPDTPQVRLDAAVVKYIEQHRAQFGLIAVPAAGDPLMAQWVRVDTLEPVGDPVPWSQVISEAVAYAAAEAQAPAAIDADLAARPISWGDAGGGASQMLVGAAPVGSPISHLPGNVWSGIAGSDAEQAPGFRPSVNLINSKVNLEREAVGVNWSNGAEVRTHIQNVWNTYAGQRDIVMPAREYLIGVSGATGANRLTVPPGLHVEGRPGALLVVNQVDNQSMPSILFAGGMDGTKTNLAANAPAGSQTVALPSGHGANFAPGDLIGFESTAAVTISNGVNVGYAREIRRIEYITSDTVALDIPLDYGYLTADAAQFWKITPASDIVVEGLEFVAGSGVTLGTDGSYALRLLKTINVHVGGIAISDMIGGILVEDAYDTVIDDPVVRNLPFFGSAFGVALIARASTTKLVVNNLRASRCRHTFTTLADERTGAPNTFWGGPMFVQLNSPIGSGSATGSIAVFDTHEFGRHIHFNNPQAYGGANSNGYQCRAQHVQYTNPRAYRCGQSGLSFFPSSKNCKVIGGEFAYNGQSGLLIQGDDHQLSSVRAHHNGGPGISYIGTNDLVIIDPDVYENTLRGISDSSVTPSVRTRIIGGRAPKSTAQTQSVANLSATSVVSGLVALGYGAGNTGLNSANASALYDIVTDTTRASNIPMSGSAVLNGVDISTAKQGLNVQSGTTYTLVLSDTGKLILPNNASPFTLTVPPNDDVAFPPDGTWMDIVQLGAGQVTVAPGSGVSILAAVGTKISARYARAKLQKIGTNSWLLTGSLAA